MICLSSSNLRVAVAILACLTLVTPSFVVGVTIIERSAQLTTSASTFTTTFDLTTGVDNSDPANGLKDAYVRLTLVSGVTWKSLEVDAKVQPGNSVTIELTNPSGFSITKGQVAGAPYQYIVDQPVDGEWTIHIEELRTDGPTSNVEVVAKAIPVQTSATDRITTTSNEGGFGTGLLLTLAGAVIVVVVAVLLVFLFVRRGREAEVEPATTVLPPPSMPPGPSPSGGGETMVIQPGTKQYYAGFEMPNGQILPITDITKEFGRDEFKQYVPGEVSSLVSRRHFRVSFSPRDRTFLIEDLGSANGTMINNTDIRGKGKMPLKNDDVISVGGVVNLKFKG